MPSMILIALAMTGAWLQGKKTNFQGQKKYVGRIQEIGKTRRRSSNFWVGLYDNTWLIAVDSCQEWVESIQSLIRNKKSFYQKGLRAIKRMRASTLASLSPSEEIQPPERPQKRGSSVSAWVGFFEALRSQAAKICQQQLFQKVKCQLAKFFAPNFVVEPSQRLAV
ncbi:hypothetical protein QUB24_12635 [Microcoleus sp. B9-D4]